MVMMLSLYLPRSYPPLIPAKAGTQGALTDSWEITSFNSNIDKRSTKPSSKHDRATVVMELE
jgi:hypothetical protein